MKILKKSMKINENQLKSDAKLPKSKFQEAARRQLAPSQAQPSPEPAQSEPSQAQGRPKPDTKNDQLATNCKKLPKSNLQYNFSDDFLRGIIFKKLAKPYQAWPPGRLAGWPAGRLAGWWLAGWPASGRLAVGRLAG